MGASGPVRPNARLDPAQPVGGLDDVVDPALGTEDLAEAVSDEVTSELAGDSSFDRYARLVQHALGVPVALVSLVEEHRQWFPGAVGLPEPWASCRETPLSHSFCQHVVAAEEPLVVTDAREVPLVADNLAISDLGVIAYAGHPITDHTGRVIGSLCAIDGEPRDWPKDHLAVLADLAEACSTELAQRGLRAVAAEESRQLRDLSQRSQVLLSLSQGLADTQTTADIAAALAEISRAHLGCLRAGVWLRPSDRALSLDRTLAGAPLGGDLASEVSGETLRYVPTPDQAWESAAVNSRFALDTSNPIGACLLAGTPTYFTSKAEQDAAYPHLVADTQIGEARAFLPLATRNQVYGVLVLLWEDVQEISDEHQVTIDVLASYTSQALQRALLFQDRMDALVTLQSALMPRLPEPEHLTLAARYLPAATLDQIGGDWFDAVVMPNGRTALMIGDVIGHDISAAAKMGQVRSMLRAFALAVPETPSESMQRLDHALVDLEMATMASLVYAQIADSGEEGDGLTLHWTNAGHPPPLLVCGDGTVTWLEGEAGDALVGVAPELERTDFQAEIPPGSTVLLYTDGLVERRGEDLTEGLARLERSATEHHSLPVEDFLDAVLFDMVHRLLDDDVALLAIRFA
jgi:serine phosphatase RsbU (regulator of sigma subunit)